MYKPAVAGPAVLGVQFGAANGVAGDTVAAVAQATLPATGIAFGLYLVAALVLIIAGFVLRRVGTSNA